MTSLHQLFDPQTLITQFGYIGLFLIIFAESGLFFGFFFPGDSLLFTAGALTAAGILPLNIWVMMILVFLGAFLGDQVGYFTGHSIGKKLFQRNNSFLFKKSYVERSEAFFAKHGNKTIVMARFVPIVRTFAPIVAGVGSMKYTTFMLYNLLGALLWGVGMTGLGYFVGNIPIVRHYIDIIVILIIVISFIPPIIEIIKESKKSKS